MKRRDGFLEAVSPDQPHRVERPAAVVVAEAVDRDDAGVLEAAGDLGFDQESPAACRIVGMAIEDLLEGDLPSQFGVERDVDGPQAPPGMRPQDLETQTA